MLYRYKSHSMLEFIFKCKKFLFSTFNILLSPPLPPNPPLLSTSGGVQLVCTGSTEPDLNFHFFWFGELRKMQPLFPRSSPIWSQTQYLGPDQRSGERLEARVCQRIHTFELVARKKRELFLKISKSRQCSQLKTFSLFQT